VIPDMELIVTAYLKGETGERIVAEPPSNLDTPWVRLTLLDAANEAASRHDHLLAHMLQLECYAGSTKNGAQAEAHDLCVAVREALGQMEGEHGDAVVTAVRFAGMVRVPDTKLEPARQRYILTAHVYAHALHP
jgi:Protein of unknown function (DUF3168)